MFNKELMQERNLLYQIQEHHLNKLYARNTPSGILICQKRSNGVRWKKRELLNGAVVMTDLHKSQKELAEKLAVNLYRMVCILYIQNKLSTIDSMINKSSSRITMEIFGYDLFYRVRNYPRTPAEFFSSQSPYRPLIISHLRKTYAGVIDWYLSDYQKNNEFPDNLLFPVKLGFNVRSKSEVMVADQLLEEGILFHYEERLPLSDGDVFTDFLIWIAISEKYAWEHFGAMDKENYAFRAKGKIVKYLDDKWLPGINMIATFETKQNPLTEEQVTQQIQWLKKRYRLALPDLPPDDSFTMYDLVTYVKSRSPDES